MLTYVVLNLWSDTGLDKQEDLAESLRALLGAQGVRLDLSRKEVTFKVVGVLPPFAEVREACAKAGFKLGIQL